MWLVPLGRISADCCRDVNCQPEQVGEELGGRVSVHV